MSDKNDIVIINLDRPRVLWYGHKALKTLCAMTGKKLSEFDDLLTDFDLENMEKIMYCGLMKDALINNEVLKLEDMEDLLDKGEFHSNMAKFNEAWSSAFGVSDGGQEKN